MSLMKKPSVDFEKEARALARIGLFSGDVNLCLKAIEIMADVDPYLAIDLLSSEFNHMRAVGSIEFKQTHLLL